MPLTSVLPASVPRTGVRVNDVHSRLNETAVDRVVHVNSVETLRSTIKAAGKAGAAVSVAGSRHAMGGQQFARDGWVLDMRPMRRVLALDREQGLVTVEAGIEWPALIEGLERLQPTEERPWSIVQKQTGADHLTIGGALASNIHGRGLQLPPIVGDVDSFVLIDASGECRVCSRTVNRHLFSAVIGGYGLLGVVAAVTLRLQRRFTVVRRVEIRDTFGLIDAFARRVAEGCAFGDFQFATDSARDSFLRTGVFSCYQRVDQDGDNTRHDAEQRSLSAADWRQLAYLAHVDKSRAFELYARHYLATDGQVYDSDTHQLAFYEPDYHAHLDTQPGVTTGTEMISELYVPRPALEAFLEDARDFLRVQHADVIYGTIRLIARDDETLLAWAREPWACIVFNLHVPHTPDGIARAADTFRGLIDLALDRGGSYYLTYHRWATPDQLRRAHPRLDEFMALKRRVDPANRFQSEWSKRYAITS